MWEKRTIDPTGCAETFRDADMQRGGKKDEPGGGDPWPGPL